MIINKTETLKIMLKKIAFLLLFIAPMSVFAQKFAHFRSVDIIQVMPEFAKAHVLVTVWKVVWSIYS